MNLQFQSESTQIHILYSRFTSLYKSILKNFVKKRVLEKPLSEIAPSNPDIFLNLDEIYMGANVTVFLQSNNIEEAELRKIKVNLLNFYVELCTQIRSRFKFDDERLIFLANFQPKVALSGNIPSIVNASKLFVNAVTNIQKLDSEWRLLADVQELKEDGNLPFDEFWKKVSDLENELQEKMFPNLTKLVQYIMCLPHSSACAERIFSKLNLIKSKLRNRLHVETCNSIILSSQLLDGKECYSWKPLFLS